MGYVVTNGEVHLNGGIYTLGQSVPAMKGELADMVEVGAVKWIDTRTATTEARKATVAKRKAKASG